MPEQAISAEAKKHSRQVNAARTSIIVSIISFLITAITGIAVDSITLILDASSGLIIFAVAILMHFSMKKIHSPPDEEFNFGYEKYESFTLMIQNVLVICTCLISVKFAIQDLIHPDNIHSYILPAAATFFSGVIGIFITVYLKRTAALTDSNMLKSAGHHWFTDTILSFGVCAGFFLGLALHQSRYAAITPYFDPLMAIGLAILLVSFPLKNITRNVLELLDAVPAQHIRSRVREAAEFYNKSHSFGIHRLRSRKAGEKIFVDVCFMVKPDMTIAEVEELSGGFEKDLKKHLPRCDVVVSFKPAA